MDEQKLDVTAQQPDAALHAQTAEITNEALPEALLEQQAAQAASAAQQNTAGWQCSCGAMANGNFCSVCGAAKPVSDEWRCSCGTVNKGNFCQNCGAKRP